MQSINKVYTFVRTDNQLNNSLAYIKSHYSNVEIENLFQKFFYKNKIYRILSISGLIINCIFKKNVLIVGDFRHIPFYVYLLFHLVKKIILVDDGLATLWFLEKSKENKFKNKTIYFTKYADLPTNFEMDAKIIKQSVTEARKCEGTRNIIFIGGPYIDFGYIERAAFIEKITMLKSLYDSEELFYFAHPQEKIELNDKKIIVVSGYKELLSETQKFANSNTIFIGCFSSGLIDIKLAYPDNKFVFFRLPNYLARHDEHLFGFNVEERIYSLFKQLGFEEFYP